jgi:predicted DNA-binding transcriptional regulator AlpA
MFANAACVSTETIITRRASPVIPPRGLSRTEAAAYLGVSPCLFDQLVTDGRMPKPKAINKRLVWDRLALDLAFEQLPERGQPERPQSNDWDLVMRN